jgi:hypothetical protein
MADPFDVIRNVQVNGKPLGLEAAAHIVFSVNEAGLIFAPASMAQTPKDVLRKMLDGFVNDPPDTDFQHGFLEGLIVAAHEALGMRMEDQTFKEASYLAYATTLPAEVQPARKKFMVIEGGKQPDEPARS